MSIAAKMREQGYLTIKDAAKHADVPYHTMYNWVTNNKVKSVRRAGREYICMKSINAFLNPSFDYSGE